MCPCRGKSPTSWRLVLMFRFAAGGQMLVCFSGGRGCTGAKPPCVCVPMLHLKKKF